jgi:hypothetical protein
VLPDWLYSNPAEQGPHHKDLGISLLRIGRQAMQDHLMSRTYRDEPMSGVRLLEPHNFLCPPPSRSFGPA